MQSNEPTFRAAKLKGFTVSDSVAVVVRYRILYAYWCYSLECFDRVHVRPKHLIDIVIDVDVQRTFIPDARRCSALRAQSVKSSYQSQSQAYSGRLETACLARLYTDWQILLAIPWIIYEFLLAFKPQNSVHVDYSNLQVQYICLLI